MFYFVNLLVLIVYSWLFKYFKIKRKKYLILTAIHIGGIIAFRSCNTGTDTYQYYNVYRMLIEYKGDLSTLIRIYVKFPGWAVFFKGVSLLFGNDPNFYMLVSGYLVVAVTWIAIGLFEVDETQSVILYYLIFALQAMNITRQNMALCLLFLSAALFIKKKRIFSFLLMCFAVSIHISAVIGVAILLVLALNWTRKRVFYAISASVIILLSVNVLFDLFASTLSGYSTYILGAFKASGRNVVMQIIYILTFLYAIWIQKKYCLDKDMEQLLLKGCILIWGEILLGTFFSIEIFIVRENLYLQIFIILFVPIVTMFFNRYRKIYRFIVYGMAFFYFSYRVLSNYGGIMPYQTYLFQK